MLIDRRSKFSHEAYIWFSYDMTVRLEIQKKMSDLYLHEISWWPYIRSSVKITAVVLVTSVSSLWITVVGPIDETTEDNIDNCVEEGKFVVDVFIVVVVSAAMGLPHTTFKFPLSPPGRILTQGGISNPVLE